MYVAMRNRTLSYYLGTAARNAAAVLIFAAIAVLIMSARSFAASGPRATGKVDASGGVNLRSAASTDSEVVSLLSDNTSLTIYREIFTSKSSTAAENRWFYVKASGLKGYIRTDCVDTVKYKTVKAIATSDANFRKGPGTEMKKKGSVGEGETVVVYLDARPVASACGSSRKWYHIKAGSKHGYIASSYIDFTDAAASANTDSDKVSEILNDASEAFGNFANTQFENYLTKQKFPSAYKKKLRALHKKHPSWLFTAYHTGITWKQALKSETVYGRSLVHSSYPSSYRNGGRQIEPGWYNASSKVVAYYMDPRNFLNEDRIYMFEDLAYRSDYQTEAVVGKIISGTKLPGYGFTIKVFMKAGKKYNISPVFLAARVVQETGGSSVSVNGAKYKGKVVYNPFNIGAYGSNPALQGLAYARKMGWTTPAKAVNGGASYLASGYISKKQNTVYFQRFNTANGLNNVGTHQYMTNVMAPYSEAYITKSSYTKLGITKEALGFMIPVYKSMPSSTKLP